MSEINQEIRKALELLDHVETTDQRILRARELIRTWQDRQDAFHKALEIDCSVSDLDLKEFRRRWQEMMLESTDVVTVYTQGTDNRED